MLPDNPGAEVKVELDTLTGNYTVFEKVGEVDYRPAGTMTFAEYEAWRRRKDERDAFKAKAGGGGEGPLASKSMIPRIYISPLFDRIFGGNYIDIRPNGSVLLDFGYRHQRVFNPQFPIRQQRNGQFLFDQQISLNAQGRIGEKLRVNINQDTKAAFEFDNTIKLDYTGFDHEILQKIEAGNVSLPISSSLIRGAQNLFGLKTTMQFGKLRVVSVISNQRGSQQSMTLRNGAQTRELSIRVNDYDDNRHYFLGHFFRNRYDQVLAAPPSVTSGTNVALPPGSGLDQTGAGGQGQMGGTGGNPNSQTSGTAGVPASTVNSGIQITRVELYVTNRANQATTLRNFVALQDLGEHNPLRNRWLFNPADSAIKPLSNRVNKLFTDSLPFRQEGIRQDTAALYDINQVQPYLIGKGLARGEDFEVVRGARRLQEDRDFTVQRQLGYLSLNTQLRDDEVLGLAMEYTFQGRAYRVGELTDDYAGRPQDQAIILKLLRPSQVRLNLPTWDLQMKNIYSLGGGGISKDNFQMRVVYRDDSSGVDNPAMPRGKRIKDVPLVQVLNLDRLDPTNELRPDGNFDYIEGVTVDSRFGRIIFPVKEPFGAWLRSKFDETDPADAALANKYVFDELYRTTKADALQAANKAKFFLIGRTQSSASNVIQLQSANLPQGSVKVFAGSTPLTEGTDYTVDYSAGQLTIINTGILNSGQQIDVRYEKQDMFQFVQRTFAGSRLDYAFDKNLNLGATLLYFNERPIVRRTPVGEEPARNTMIGLDFNYKSDSRFLTKMVDALPLIQTKAVSTITASGEYARLFPGANRFVDASGRGISFVDDFETSRIPIQTFLQPLKWRLSSTPVGYDGLPDDTSRFARTVAFGNRRAAINWKLIDNTFYNPNSPLRPGNLQPIDLTNNYVRAIGPQEIAKNRDLQPANFIEPVFDIAYYPQERGPYNYTTRLQPNGRLRPDNLRSNWGGLITDFSTQTDFDYNNVEYIEFWMMDPFLNETVGGNADGSRRRGRLVFDLGQISEDIIRDGRQGFEAGLPGNGDATLVDETPVGNVPRTLPINDNVFGNEPADRANQDVGLDGLSNAAEAQRFRQYLDRLADMRTQGLLTDSVYNAAVADPSNDNWQYFLGAELDAADAKVLDRYKRWNLPDGNSPIAGGAFARSYTPNADKEDLNNDKTLNELDAYFSYKIDFEPERFRVGDNYIVDKVEGANNSQWFLFRIPVKELGHPNALPPTGGIADFKTIKFMRMYFTGFEVPVAARMYQFQLVANQWRKYPKRLTNFGASVVDEDASDFTVATVNVEENGPAAAATPTGGRTRMPYFVPPGAQARDRDITAGNARRLNEQSLSLCISNLRDGDAKAVFKNVRYDFLNYGRVQAYVHANTLDASTKDGELEVFVRMGTDFTDNFYEVAVPLRLTPYLSNLDLYNPNNVWPQDNFINCELKELWGLKLRRNAAGISFNIPFADTVGNQRVAVVGNPDLNAVLTLMIGIRNPTSQDGFTKSACVWINEFRVTDYIRNDGWAATGTLNAKLADFATVQASGRYITPGFGGIEQKISERSRETAATYTISSNIQLDRFIPNNQRKVGLKVPMFVAFERTTSSPQFDPLNPDVPLASVPREGPRADYRDRVIDQTTRRSLNFSNVQKTRVKQDAKPKPYDIENLSVTFAYTDVKRTNITIADFTQRQINYGAGYNYAAEPRTLEPFKKLKVFDNKYLRLIKDINFTPLPASIIVRADLLRNFTRTQLRSSDIYAPLSPALLTFEKSLLFNRQYAVRWLPFRSLSVDYSANASAVVDEPAGDIRGNTAKQDTIYQRILQLGRLKTYNQTVRFGYKLPLDKLPFTDWIQADVSYTAGLNWAAAPLALQDTLGNILQNSRDRALNARVDLLRLYNKSKFLQKINTPPPAKPPVPKAAPKQLTPAQKAEAARKEREEKAKRDKERRRLELAITQAKNKKAPGKQVDSLQTLVKNLDRKERAAKAKDTTKKGGGIDLLRPLLRTLMSVRQINLQYQVTDNTVLPGYRPTPSYAGLTDVANWAPGIPFVLGSQDPEIRVRMAQQELLGKSTFQTAPFQQAQTSTFSANTTLEPLRDFRLRLDVRQTQTANYSEIFRFDTTGGLGGFQSFSPVRGGSYTTSFVALGSFRLNQSAGDDALNRSQEWSRFLGNQVELRDRLNTDNPLSRFNRGGDSTAPVYTNTNQDVLIPAFRAAYTGRTGAEADKAKFPQIPLPNWRIDYSGLSKIPAIGAIFPSFTVSHAYTSTYTIDRFVSSLAYGADRLNLSNRADQMASQANAQREFVPVVNVTQVVITEKFAPLIGFDVRTRSKITMRLAYNRDRAMSLNIANAQVTEVRSQDVVFGVGFARSGVQVPFIKDKGRPIILKNELTLRSDFTIRDNRTIQRIYDAGHLFTAGSLDIQFKPTLNYVVSQRLNVQFYFERTINQPRVSTSFLRKLTAFGFQLRFALQ